MKRFFIIFFLCLLLAFFGGMFWLRHGSGDYIASLIQKYSALYGGSEARLAAKPEISLFPPALALPGISWTAPDKSCEFNAASLKVMPDLSALFTRRLVFREIQLDSPELRLKLTGTGSGQGSSTGSGKGMKRLPLEVERLIIQKGALLLTGKTGEYAFRDFNLSAENLAPRQETTLAGDFVLAAREIGKSADSLEGNLAFRARARYYEPNLTFRHASITFTATSGELPLWLSPMQLALEGALNFDTLHLRLNSATLSSPPGSINFKGESDLAQGQISGQCTLSLALAEILNQKGDSGQGSGLVIDSPIRYDGASISLPEIAIRAQNTEGSGNLAFRLPQEADTGALTGSLSFRSLQLWPGNGQKNGPPKKETASSKPPFNLFPEISLRLAADKFLYGGFRAENVAALLSGSKGAYRLQEAALEWAGGKIQATGSADFANSLFSVNASGTGIDAGRALQESGFNGFDGGMATFDTALATKGLDLQSVARTLDGNASFSATGVRVNLLEKIARFLPDNMGSASFPDLVELLSAKMSASSGTLKLDPLKLEAKSLQASGKADYTAANEYIKGNLDLKLGPVSLPLVFQGPARDISWNVSGGFLKQLLHDLP